MDFSNERYVRLYVRDTTTWLMLEFEGQTVLMHLLRKADRAGVIDLAGREPWTAPVVHCRIPADFARKGMEACLREGVVVHDGDRLVFPRYIEANEAPTSDKQRAKDSRDKRAALSRNVTAPSQPVTETSHSVTARHDASQRVTLRRAVPCLSDPCLADADLKRGDFGGSLVTYPPLDPNEDAPDEVKGSKWLSFVTGWEPYSAVGKWRTPLGLLWRKPAAERAAAQAVLSFEAKKLDAHDYLTPSHILDYWHMYSAGRAPGRQKRAAGMAPVASAAEFAADRAGGPDPWE